MAIKMCRIGLIIGFPYQSPWCIFFVRILSFINLSFTPVNYTRHKSVVTTCQRSYEKEMFLVVSVCLFTGGGESHVTITHGALDLTVKALTPPPQDIPYFTTFPTSPTTWRPAFIPSIVPEVRHDHEVWWMSVVLFISFVSVLLRCFHIPRHGIPRVTHLTEIWEMRFRLRLIHTHWAKAKVSDKGVFFHRTKEFMDYLWLE